MDQIIHVFPHQEGWGFQLGAEIAGSYRTKEAAATAAKNYASRLLGEDRDVMIIVPMKDTA
jgi:hypothetical protein